MTMGFCHHVWCVQCHSIAHFRLSRLVPVVVHKESCFTPSRHQRFFQNYAGLSVALKPTTPSSRMLASLSLSSAAFRAQSLPASSLFFKTSLTLSCLPIKRWFAQGSTPPRSQYRIDQDKEKAVLSEYERTYSPNKKYTKRTLKEDEVEDENEIFDDMKPEDTFGTLTNQYKKQFNVKGDLFDLEVDSDDDQEKQKLKPLGRRNTPIWYGNQMKKLVKEGKLMEAIDMLEIRMLKEDRVHPTEFNYNVLIGACGREGYTKKAFELYNQMKKRGLTPSEVTFTSLFNACAESPWPMTDGITRLCKLHSQLKEKDIVVNKITHHAMIKAYAKCGDLQAAFDLFRELLVSGVELEAESFAFLLFACASDKESGLMYGIEAWRQLLQRGIKPNIYIYNLLLRISRDCGIGDTEVASRLLLKPRMDNQMKKLPASTKKGKKSQRSYQPPKEGSKGQTHPEEMIQVTPFEVKDSARQEAPRDMESPPHESEDALNRSLAHQQEQLPNLLDLSPDFSRVQSLANVSTPSDRLALLGGATGILDSMKGHGVIPDVKALTLLMEGLPMTSWDEDRLLDAVDEYKVKVDVDFFNAVIRRRSRRADLEGAKAVLPLIHQQGLFPNMRTFVNLACECAKAQDGIQLLKDIKVAGLKPTVYVYGALITAASRRYNYRYLTELLKCMENDNLSPDKLILERLETMAAFGDNPNKSTLNKKELLQQRKLNHYRGFYIKWLDQMGLEERPHPWKKFYRPRDVMATEDME